MSGDRLRRGRRAKLLAQQRPQRLEHAQALGDVALRRERLHQQHVAGLAVGLGVDQAPGGALDRGKLRAAEVQPRAPDHLERLQPHVLESRRRRDSSQVAWEPGSSPRPAMLSGTCASAQALRASPRSSACRARSTSSAAASRSIQTGGGRLRISSSRPAARCSERRAQPREQRPQRRVLRNGRVVGPQRADQLLAADVPGAVEQQVGEQQRHLLAAQGRPRAARRRSLRTTVRRAGFGFSQYAVPATGNDLETYRQRATGNLADRGDRGLTNRRARWGARGGANPMTRVI